MAIQQTNSTQSSLPRSQQLRDDKVPTDLKRRHVVTIFKKPEEVYAFFREFKNLSLFMADVKEVRGLTQKISHWIVDTGTESTLEWDTEITSEIPGKLIEWQSTPESSVQQKGRVRFEKAPGNYGTVVELSVDYDLPGGKVSELAVKLVGQNPEAHIQKNLRRLKAYIETGEVPTVEGQPSGREEDSEDLTKSNKH